MSFPEILRAMGAMGGIGLIVVLSQWGKRSLKRKLRRGCNRFFPVL